MPRLSLRALMLVVLIIGGMLGWEVNRARVQGEACKAINEAGFGFNYRWRWASWSSDRVPRSLLWLIELVGPDLFRDIVWVDAGWNTNPKVDDEVIGHIGRLGRLERLSLHGSVGVTDEMLTVVSTLSRLRVLSLDRTGVSSSALSRLKALKRLQVLILGDVPLTDVAMADLASLESLNDLSSTNCQDVTDAGLAELRGLNLSSLELVNGSQITTEGLKSLQTMHQLYNLGLSFSLVDSLEPISGLDQLVQLRLHKNRLTDEGIKSLSNLKNLDRLFLGDEKLGDESLKVIGKIDSLRYLDLSRTEISDEGVVQLKNLNRLTNLELLQTKVTAEGVAWLKTKFPTTVITK